LFPNCLLFIKPYIESMSESELTNLEVEVFRFNLRMDEYYICIGGSCVRENDEADGDPRD